MTRTILHLDLDAFFCAVEEQRDPTLKSKAFAVGGRPEERGVVASCSYPARQYGVRSAMPMSRALQLCPHLLIVHRHFSLYQEASRKVMSILHELTPLVEKLSIDEAFLDMTGMQKLGEEIARDLQTRIRTELNLPCSLGVASNKLVAKTATTVGKARVQTGESPNSIEVVPTGEEAAFMARLPVRELWGVGPKTAERLHDMKIEMIGDLAQQNELVMVKRFGKIGYDLLKRARGIDTRPVETERDTKSISREITYTKDVLNGERLHESLREMAEDVGRQLRKQHLRGMTVKIKLRWANFDTVTRQVTLAQPTDRDNIITEAAQQLLDKTWERGKAVRLLGVGMSGFESDTKQMSLWDKPPTQEPQELKNTLRSLRNRFGDDAIVRGSDLKDEE